MSGTLVVQNIQGPSSGANANKIIIPSGQTLDASAGTFVPPAGAVTNIYYVTSGTQTKGSAASWVDTAFTKAVTPTSASSKFYVTFTAGGLVNNVQYIGLRILRDSTVVSKNWSYHNRQEQWNGTFTFAIQGLDEPSTTSSVTYKIQVYISQNGNDHYFNYGGLDGGIGNLTIMEIAG